MKQFEIGPDKVGDIRQHRPYFAVQLERDDRLVPYLEQAVSTGSPREEADSLCRRILGYTSLAKDEPGDLLLTEAQIVNPEGLRTFLCDAWRVTDGGATAEAPPGALLLKRITDPTIVHALENSPDGAVALLLQALNGAIERRPLFFDNDDGRTDARLAGQIADEIERNPAVRMGIATILAEPKDAGFPTRLNGERGLAGAELARRLLDYLSSPKALDTPSRLRVFVNRLLVGLAFAGFIAPIGARGPVTDIYLLSHGWHRNYYQATSAYDRLVSRFTRLLNRQVLETDAPFHPLILGAHWHSDPGEDGWVDPAGRRDKRSYLQNVELLFERPSADAEADVPREDRFTRVFEECFEFFGHMSTEDVHALSDDAMGAKASELAQRLDRFTLRDAASALEHDKMAAVWTCYHEALPKQVLTDQTLPPARGMSFGQALKNLLRFVLGAAGISVVLGLLLKSSLDERLKGSAIKGLDALHHHVAGWWPGVAQRLSGHPTLTAIWSDLLWVPVAVLLLFVAALVGWLFLHFRARPGAPKRRRGVSYWTVAAWAPVEMLHFIPALLLLLVTYFFSRRSQTDSGGIFAERTGQRNEPITDEQRKAALAGLDFPKRTRRAPARRWAAWLSMQPIALYKKTLAQGNPDRDLFAGFENLLAFYEMQVRGTVAGGTAGQFLTRIVRDMTAQGLCRPDVRVHLVGHSFGGLVVLNAARHAVLDPWCLQPDGTPTIKVHSLTLLQGAVAANWVEGETAMLQNMTGALGCAYSAYDTANGFYYPVANGGRLAAGFTGLFGVPGQRFPRPATRIPRLEGNNFTDFDTVPADRGLLAMLVEPPPLGEIVRELPASDRQALNLDMSRIVYEGPIPLGGGHADVYKDDVINLVWAVSRLGNDVGPALSRPGKRRLRFAEAPGTAQTATAETVVTEKVGSG